MNRCVVVVGLAASVAVVPAVGAPPTYFDAVADANPILWYRMNEASGNIINRGTLGSGFSAFPTGTIMRGVGTAGGDVGIGFDSGDVLESLGASPLVGNPTFSIEAVVRLASPAPAGRWGTFLHWGDGPAGDRTGREVYFGIQSDNNQRLYAGFYNAGVRTVGNVPTNSWMHVVWTRQGGNNSETGSTIYVNGSPVAVQRDTDLIPGILTAAQIAVNSTPFRVNSGRDFPGQRFFTGAIDELALYDRLLTPAEIAHRADLALCPGDFNADGALNSQDFFDFISAFFAQLRSADFNADNAINSQDFFDYLAVFFAGCP